MPGCDTLIEAGWEAQQIFDQVTSTGPIRPVPVNINFFPNPMKEVAQLTLDKQGDQITELSLYNSKGMKLRQYNTVFKESIQIARENLPAGIYFYLLHTENGAQYSGKFIIQ